MTTLKEIAEMCGVTTSTVSNVLNGKPKVGEATKKRVLEAVEKTGYQPNFFAQGIRKLKTRIIGILTEDLTEIASTVPIIEAVMAHCEDKGYRTILINLRMYDKWKDTWYNDEARFQEMVQPAIRELLSIKVDGIVYVAGHCRNINCFPKDFTIPGVMVYGISTDMRFPSIVIDDEKGCCDMTRYLISMGHERIGVIAGVLNNIHTQKRLLGYQKALYESGVLYNPEMVVFGNWERDSGYKQAEILLREGATALMCMNDRMAAGAYDYLYEHGFAIGKDISVTGYDNMEMSGYLRPLLTTLDMCLKDVGRIAAKTIMEMVEEEAGGEPQDGMIRIPGRLVVRESVVKL